MFGSLLILLILPLTDVSRIRGCQFRPIMKFFFWAFVVNFFILMWIGSQHPNTPYVEIGQIATAFYFAWFILIVPMVGLLENSLMDIATENKELAYSNGAKTEKIGSLMRFASTGAASSSAASSSAASSSATSTTAASTTAGSSTVVDSTTVEVTNNELDSLLAGVFREVHPSNIIEMELLESYGLYNRDIVAYVETLGYIVT